MSDTLNSAILALKNYPEGLSTKELADLLHLTTTQAQHLMVDNKEHFHASAPCSRFSVWKLGPEPSFLQNLPPNSIFDYATRMLHSSGQE